MQNVNQKSPEALVICAPFFTYHQSIISELESRGMSVTWSNDRASDHSLYKILLRIMPHIVARLSTQYFIRRINRLNLRFIQHVLVVKGEGVSPSAIRAMRRSMPAARFHLYLWDGVDNVRGATAIAPLFDSVATFDPDDAQYFGWRYRPLFASNIALAPDVPEDGWEHDWTFIGSLHSDRFKILRKLLIINKDLHSFVYGFIPGKLIWLLRHLTNWSLWRPSTIKISTVPLPANKVRQIVERARAVIDIEHPNQRGLTMRTIETLMSHRKLITTNARIRDTDLYDKTRVCIIDRNVPFIPRSFFETNFRPLDENTRNRYSLKRWIDDIIYKT